jgi:hypothetical protein
VTQDKGRIERDWLLGRLVARQPTPPNRPLPISTVPDGRSPATGLRDHPATGLRDRRATTAATA